MFFWTFYASNNPEKKYYGFHKKLSSTTVFKMYCNKKYFLSIKLAYYNLTFLISYVRWLNMS